MPINFKINVKGLLEGIQPAVVVASTGVIKEFHSAKHLSLEATPECLFVNANGGRMSVRNPIPYMTTYCTDYVYKEGGNATVAAEDLVEVLSSFKIDEVLLVESIEAPTVALAEDATEDEQEAFARLTGTELRLIPQSDPQQYQTLPIFGIPVVVQALTGKAEHTIVVPTSTFCATIKKIIFAGGFEETRPKYLYWKLHTEKDRTRFIAGTGARFANIDVRGDGKGVCSEDATILIPVEQSSTLLKVFTTSGYPTISINYYGNRISFEAESLRLVCAGLDTNIKWIDENEILDRTNSYKFSIAINELDLAIKGILATNNELDKKRDPVHAATMTFDAKKRLLSMCSDRSTKKALRKVPLADVWVAPDQPNEVAFRCGANFIQEAVKFADKSTHVQFELLGTNDPMVVRANAGAKVANEPLYASNVATNSEESFTMFIAKLNGK